MKYITIQKPYDIKLKNTITKYMTPKYVALPILEEITFSKSTVKKEEKIANQIISPISGKIIGEEECVLASGKKQRCLLIENNYHEAIYKKNYVRKNLTDMSPKEVQKELEAWGSLELQKKFWHISENLICNTIEDEPYVENETFISIQYTNILLETLDALRTIFGLKQICIVAQNNNRNLIETFSNFLGTYPHIELKFIPPYYLLEQEPFLKKYLHNEKITVLKPSEVLQIYQIIKRRKKLTEHIFTVSGNAIENPQVIEAKFGTSIAEIRKELIKETEQDSIIYINGLMKGLNFNIKKLIVTPELKSIFIMKREEKSSEKCINCGKCYQICPIHCNPRAYLDNRKKEEIKHCIDCGLCSYICPSHINLRKEIQGD